MRKDFMAKMQQCHQRINQQDLRALSIADDDFEILEFLGDAVIAYEVTNNLVNIYGKVLGPGTLTPMKHACISNKTLASLFDLLELDKLVKSNLDGRREKVKADIVEAIVGELSKKREDPEARVIIRTIVSALVFLGSTTKE